ncbi:MAG: hypothetical protein WBB28_22175 [Crinalium sp.]
MTTPKQQAANLHTPPEQLRKLAKESIELARIVAKNPSADPELLQELAVSPDLAICKGVAANPNTPANVLFNLGMGFPKQLLANPVFPQIIQQNFNWRSRFSSSQWREVLKKQELPKWFFEWIAEYADYDAVIAILNNPHTPKNALEKIIQTRNICQEYSWILIGEELEAQNTELVETAKLHINWGEVSSDNFEPIVKAAMLKYLLQRDWKIEAKLWAMGLIPEFLLPILDQRLRKAIALNPHTSTPVLEQLAVDNHVGVRRCVAENPNAPWHILEQLVGDNLEYVRESAAAHPKISFTILDNFKSQYQAVTNREATVELLTELARSKGVVIRQQVAAHSNTPPNVLEQLAADKDFRVRLEVAENSNIPLYLQTELAQDADAYVRQALANNSNTAIAIIEQLLKDEVKEVQEAAINKFANIAQNPATSQNILEQLAKSKNWRLSMAVARNPHIFQQILEKLAKHQKWEVRAAVANNYNTTTVLLEQFLKDENYVVEEVAFNAINNFNIASSKQIIQAFRDVNNPETNADILSQLATSESRLIRVGVAKHIKTPPLVLEQLSRDKNIEVRLAVANNYNAPIYVLQEMAKRGGKNKPIQLAAIKNLLARQVEGSDKFIEKYAKSSTPCLSRLLVLLHPMATRELLTKWYRSSSWLERYAIASHPNTPPEVLIFLAEDANHLVRTAAINKLSVI